MRGIWGRLLLPFLISVLGYALTLYWYFRTGPDTEDLYSGMQPIAYLKEGVNEIDKRPAKRLIWQPVTIGDQMYAGERIRTSSRAEGLVQLVDSGTAIGLEPDSLIVLEKSKGEVSLDLLDGALFVKNVKEPEQPSGSKKTSDKTKMAALTKAPIIKAGTTKIELGTKDAEMSLSIDKKGQANVAVTKGQVEVKGSDSKNNVVLKEGAAGNITKKGITQDEVIQVITPAANAVIDVGDTSAGAGSAVLFKWKPISADYKVFLHKGESRDVLTRFTTSPVSGSAGAMKVNLPVGVFFWQLIATKGNAPDSSDAMKSLVFRAEAATFAPPEIMGPIANEKIFLAEGPASVELNWIAPKGLSKFIVEIATNKDFSKTILTKKLEGKNSFSINFPQDSKTGKYFWRVSGDWPGRADPTRSQVGEFIIEKAITLDPPELKSPNIGEKIFASKMQNEGLFLEWEQVGFADSYRVLIEPKSQEKNADNRIKKDIMDTSFRVTKLPAGEYLWSVQSVKEKKSSAWSKPRTFSVLRMAQLAWQEPSENVIIYSEPKPKVTLKWQSGPKEATSWRIRYAPESSSVTESSWKTVKSSFVSISLEKEGIYNFQAQALAGINNDGSPNVLGETPTLKLELKPNPALPPPTFASSNFSKGGAKITAKPDGTAFVIWSKVPGAQKYIVRLEDQKTKNASKLEVKDTKIKLKDLLPGEYKISLGSMNQNGEVGSFGPQKTIEVPKQSNIAAPVVKKIQIK